MLKLVWLSFFLLAACGLESEVNEARGISGPGTNAGGDKKLSSFPTLKKEFQLTPLDRVDEVKIRDVSCGQEKSCGLLTQISGQSIRFRISFDLAKVLKVGDIVGLQFLEDIEKKLLNVVAVESKDKTVYLQGSEPIINAEKISVRVVKVETTADAESLKLNLVMDRPRKTGEWNFSKALYSFFEDHDRSILRRGEPFTVITEAGEVRALIFNYGEQVLWNH